MKKLFSILFFVIGSQIALAHPGVEHHSHDSFFGETAWLIIPLIATIAILWKFSKSRSKSSKS